VERSAGLAMAGLLAVFALALAARSVGYELVFLADGGIVYAAGDAWYHMRRALFSFANFPSYLTFDRCLAHPDGSPVPWPPLWDLALASAGLLAGGTRRSFEVAGAWLPVVAGAAAVFPVYAMARRFAGRAVGLGAAAIYALLPAAIEFARVGNPDHHAAVALLGACLLSLYVAILDERTAGRSLVRAAVLLALARGAMLLVWPGTLLYMALGELAAGLLPGRRDRIAALAGSSLGSLAIVLPVVLRAARPLGGPFSATEISWLHIGALAAMAIALGAVLVAMRRGSAGTAASRLGVAAGAGAALLVAGLLLAPGLAGGFGAAFSFLSGTDAIGGANLELMPLLQLQGQSALVAGAHWMGLYLLLAPLVPLAFLSLRDDADLGGAAWLLAGWTFLFALLTSEQIRYMNDYAPAACVGFALVLELARRRLAARMPAAIAGALAVAVGVAAIVPAVALYHLPYLAAVRRGAGAGDRALYTVAGTQMRFAEAVRAATPETPGCGAAPGVPEYGILAHPAIGHALHYTAERATPADPFGPYIGAETYEKVRRFFQTSSESDAVAIARELDAPYVVTTEDVKPGPDTLLYRLHVENGGSSGTAPQWSRFRLLEEGPRDGRSLTGEFASASQSRIPYKLYEIVEGAVLEAHAAPGSTVRAQIAIRTPLRSFEWTAIALAGDDGVARLRVPYPTIGGGRVHAQGRYRVELGGRTADVEVRDEQVRAGAAVPVIAPRREQPVR
jgi:asparagine N-glycosylation enzyme membrane subunit Stt3